LVLSSVFALTVVAIVNDGIIGSFTGSCGAPFCVNSASLGLVAHSCSVVILMALEALGYIALSMENFADFEFTVL
jgi:hypothetical protein